MKSFYIAVQIQENGKYYAFMLRANESHNLYFELSRIAGIVAANIFPTLKAARATVDAWNESFKNNGIFLFDSIDGEPAPF